MKAVILNDKTFSLFISKSKINQRTKQLGKQLNKTYANKNPVFIGVLNGSFMFMATLLKNVKLNCETSFVKVSSYQGGLQSTGQINEVFGLDVNLANRHVILVEDIVDTGQTLKFLEAKVKAQNPASLSIVTLLLKPEALLQPVNIAYIGFEIPNHFVVGYGMDYNGLGRNLNDIYKL